MSEKALNIVVVGSGPVGVHFCNEMLRQNPDAQLHLIGEEPYEPYNRVVLSQLLYGEKTLEQIRLPLSDDSRLTTHWHTRVTEIDSDKKQVLTNHGNQISYDKLILATGSRAHVPNLPGVNLPGVYCFRNLADAEALASRRVGSRHMVVLGGGLLGIETARAMARKGNKITLIHHSGWLMNRQLDEGSATRLKENLESLGIEVRLSESILAVDGARKVTGLILRSGQMLETDTLILATGIQPNVELAKEAGISSLYGIRVDDTLETSQSDVFAIGECAEVNGEVYGLVAPGLEQASVLARRFSNEPDALYEHRALATRLKVLDTPVSSMGEMGLLHDTRESEYQVFEKGDIRRVLRFERGQLKGAAGIGAWSDQEQLSDLIANGENLNPLQRLRFRLTGELWSSDEQVQDHHIICNCRHISAGELRACQAAGNQPSSTGAGSVCGSCVPLLAQFDPSKPVAEKPKGEPALALFSLIALALMIIFQQLSPFGAPENYINPHISDWWIDSDKRQITGFTLLGLTVVSLIMSLRKRIRSFGFISFAFWRWMHVVLTTAMLAILFLHTGVSEFQGINAWLIYSFWTTALLGVISSLLTHKEAAKPGISSKRHKRWLVMGHIIAFWPLPVLLSFHVLSVYWF
ncbi:MAG: FAD-dependent oxidoreductase [Oceanobacter sp.]